MGVYIKATTLLTYLRTPTGSELFSLFGRDFEQIFEQVVSLRVKALSNSNVIGSRHIQREKGCFRLTYVAHKRRSFFKKKSLFENSPRNFATMVTWPHTFSF